MNIESKPRELYISDNSHGLAYPLQQYECLNDKIVLLLSTYNQHTDLIDYLDIAVNIDVKREKCNIVCISSDSSMLWTVSQPSDPYSGDDSHNIYKYMFTIGEQLFAIHNNGILYQINTSSGKITGSWEDNQLPFESHIVDLDGTIDTVLTVDDTIVIRINDENTDQGDTYAFDNDGNQLWRSDTHLGDIFVEEGTLHAKTSAGPRSSLIYTVDISSGAIINKETVSDMN